MKLLLLSIFLSTVSAVIPNCPAGWSSFDGATKCYRHVDLPAYNDPVSLLMGCPYGSSPASIHSSFENSFMRTLSNMSTGPFFGLMWVDDALKNFDGSPVDYTFQWAYNDQPKKGEDNSLIFIEPVENWHWSYMSFNNNYGKHFHGGVICQRDPIQQPATCSQCPQGFVQGTTRYTQSFCYYVGNTSNWNDASEVCKSKNSVLASIHSQDENNFVTSLSSSNGNLGDDQQVWLGGVYFVNKWAWSDGAPLDYTNWGASNGNVNGISLPCLVLRTTANPLTTSTRQGQWYPYDCSKTQRKFVCKTLAQQH